MQHDPPDLLLWCSAAPKQEEEGMSVWSAATLVLVALGLLGVAFIAGMVVGQWRMLRVVEKMLADYGLELTRAQETR